jgi:hypothetical protein
MKHHFLFFHVLAAPCLLLAVVTSAPADQPASDFLSDAEAAWRAYGQFGVKLQGTIKSTFYDIHEGKRTIRRVVEGEFKQCGPRWLWSTLIKEDKSTDAGNRGSAKVITGAGAFRLTRKEVDSPWVLTHYSPDTPDPEWIKESDPRIYVAKDTQAGLYFWGISLSELERTPGFTFTTAAREQRQGEELVRFHFTFRPPARTQIPFRSGWLLLDPARSWLIREYQFEGPVEQKSRNHSVFDYKQGPSGFPLVRRYFTHVDSLADSDKPVSTFELEIEYNLHEQESVPQAEFTLTAFGLPEPSRRREWPTYWYLVGAGLACFMLAAAFRWRVRRTSAPS